jgi:cobyrinic acid a,c-diamide synthase
MWLGRALTDLKGTRHAMVGALPAQLRMTARLQHFGYTELEAKAGHAFLPRGLRLKGHEFHHSVLQAQAPLAAVGRLAQSGRPSRDEAWALPGGMATYFHAYLPSAPLAAEAFAAHCRRWRTV